MTDDLRRWPLADREDALARIARLSGGDVTAGLVTGLFQVALRVDPSRTGPLPFAVPREAGTVATDVHHEVLWLGPDEWLVVTPRDAADVMSTIDASLGTDPHAAVDMSANRAIVELSGVGRHQLLESRCPLDLHPRSWRAEMCAQTLLGRAQVVLQHRGDATRVFVRPSFGAYVVDVLVDAAAMLDVSP